MIEVRPVEMDDMFAVTELVRKSFLEFDDKQISEIIKEIFEDVVDYPNANDCVSCKNTYVAIKGYEIVGILNFVVNSQQMVRINPLLVSDDVRDVKVSRKLLKKAVEHAGKYRNQQKMRQLGLVYT